MPAALSGPLGRVVLALLAAVALFLGGYLYRGYSDAQRAASQAVEAPVKAAKARTAADLKAAQDRSRALTNTQASLDALRGYSPGLRGGAKDADQNAYQNAPETDETGRGCSPDPWGGDEYRGLLHDAVRAGNEALGSARPVP